jgi:hypothetical protein
MQISRSPRLITAALAVCLSAIFASVELTHASVLPTPTRLAAPDTVRGLVYDSLTNAPLADAFVTAEGVGASTTSDSLGRFTLVSDQRITRITAFHEALDQTGFGGLQAERPATAVRWTDATLATPSLGTVWRSVCKLELPEGDKRGVLVGSARLPDNTTRVAGAAIRVQYQVILPRTGLPQLEELEAITDSLGSFVVCGAPVYGEVAVIGLSSQVQSGAVRVAFESRPLLRMDLVLGPVDGPVSKWPTITGRVVSDSNAAIAGAQVFIEGRDSSVLTGADGSFSLREVPPGSRMITVAATGYPAMASQVDVLYENTPSVTVQMQRGFTIAGLEGLNVTERTTIRRSRRDFEERRSDGRAWFVDSSEITAAGSLRTALTTVPGLMIETAIGETDEKLFDIFSYGRNLGVRACQAALFIDAVPAKITDIRALALAEIAAIEIYRNEAYAPEIFSAFAKGDCAVVGFWTRFGLRP